MSTEVLNNAYVEIDKFRTKLGEIFMDAVTEDDNTSYKMAKGILSTFADCTTEQEFKAANHMLTAVCGYSFECLVSKIKERDSKGYVWEDSR